MDGARPRRGQVKGKKLTYDPELDKTISSKERRSRQPQYKDIVSEVWLRFLGTEDKDSLMITTG